MTDTTKETPVPDATNPADYLTEVAPWPKSQDEVTAESLGKAFAAMAYAIDLGELMHAAETADNEAEEKLGWQKFGTAVSIKVRNAAIADLLRRLPADAANEAAVAAWSLFEFGEADEFLHDWLTEWGIDPARLLPDGTPA